MHKGIPNFDEHFTLEEKEVIKQYTLNFSVAFGAELARLASNIFDPYNGIARKPDRNTAFVTAVRVWLARRLFLRDCKIFSSIEDEEQANGVGLLGSGS